jgi:hypothetical protein
MCVSLSYELLLVDGRRGWPTKGPVAWYCPPRATVLTRPPPPPAGETCTGECRCGSGSRWSSRGRRPFRYKTVNNNKTHLSNISGCNGLRSMPTGTKTSKQDAFASSFNIFGAHEYQPAGYQGNSHIKTAPPCWGRPRAKEQREKPLPSAYGEFTGTLQGTRTYECTAKAPRGRPREHEHQPTLQAEYRAAEMSIGGGGRGARTA